MAESLLNRMNKYISSYSEENEIRKGVFSLIEDESLKKIHPEAEKDKNSIMIEVDKSLKNEKKFLNDLELYSLLYRLANEVVAEKSNQVLELKNLLEKTNIPIDLKARLEEKENIMSQKIVSMYGILKSIASKKITKESMKEFKTMIVSILSINTENEKEKNITLNMLRDLAQEKGIDYKKVESFFKENKELTKLDKYIEELKKAMEIQEKESTQTRKQRKDRENIGI